MSNATAIAAVTGALCTLFGKIASMQSALADLKVTAVPPDQAGTDVSTSAINVFLYQVATNAAWRNMNVPRQVPAGGIASPPPEIPPAALDLNYLITAYGKDNDDTLAHLALAEVVSLLADNACLSPQLIQAAVVNSAITGIDLGQQAERVRLTPKPLNIEEISKLWTIFQAKYRVSVSYQVSVVLIDSAQPPRAPLPVTSFNIGVAPGSTTLPTLTRMALPGGQQSARLGDSVVLSGYNLGGSGDNLAVLFQSPLLAAPLLTATVTARSPATSVTVTDPRTTRRRRRRGRRARTWCRSAATTRLQPVEAPPRRVPPTPWRSRWRRASRPSRRRRRRGRAPAPSPCSAARWCGRSSGCRWWWATPRSPSRPSRPLPAT